MIRHLDYMPVIGGDPQSVTNESHHLSAVVSVITALTDDLTRLADENLAVGDASDVMRERTRGAAAEIRTVAPRYEQTAAALSEYAVVLRDVQAIVTATRGEVDEDERAVLRLTSQMRELHRERDYAQMSGDHARVEAIWGELAMYQRFLESAEHGIQSARARYDQAADRHRVAGDTAAARIRMELGTLNDSFLDVVVDRFATAWEALAAVAEWIGRILVTVIESVLLIVFVVVALVVVVAVALLFSNLLMLLYSSGLLSLDQIVESLVGVALVIVPLAAIGLVTALMAREALTPTPDVVPVREYLGGRLVDKGARSDYEHLFDTNGQLDEAGGRDKTVVEIVQVMDENGAPALDENGNPIWRVTFPSTMDWEIMKGSFGDNGAVNDLGSNLALILSPDMQAAYERAALQAMRDAGIGPNDSVMLAGWSQGGILAGAIASDPNSGFNVQAIAVAGSPIDHMPIPRDVAVVSIQHTGDHVHLLDGTRAHQGPNWVTVQQDSGGSGYPHDIGLYTSSAASLDSPHVQDRYPDLAGVMHDQQMFFSDYEIAHRFEFAETDSAIW